jgi:hypothetical protein
MEAAVEGLDAETRVPDRRFGIARRLTAAERPRPEDGVDGPLERSERRIAGTDVLPEAKLATGNEHAPELPQRRGGVGNAAKNTHDDGGVEGAVLPRQGNGVPVHDVDRNRRSRRALRRCRPSRGIGLDGKDMLDLDWVVLERAPIAGADLDHATAEAVENLTTDVAVDEVGLAGLPPLEVAREAGLLGAVERRRRQRSISSTWYSSEWL